MFVSSMLFDINGTVKTVSPFSCGLEFIKSGKGVCFFGLGTNLGKRNGKIMMSLPLCIYFREFDICLCGGVKVRKVEFLNDYSWSVG